MTSDQIDLCAQRCKDRVAIIHACCRASIDLVSHLGGACDLL